MKGFYGEYVLTSDGLKKDRMIVTSNGEIKEIGSKSEMEEKYEIDQVIGQDHIIIPGFVNLHTHVSMIPMLGVGEEKDISNWLNNYIWPIENRITPEDIYWSSLLGMLELLKSGTTTIVDHYFHMGKVAKAARKSGMRSVLAQTVMDRGGTEVALMKGENFIKRYQDKELIEPWVGPHAADTCSKELLVRSRDLAEEYNTGLHIHLSQSKNEVKDVKNRFGVRPTELLRDLDILGPETIAAHCVYLSDEDVRILGDTSTNVAHCAISLSKLDGQVGPMMDLMESGANVGIGNDCFSYDMFPELRSVGILNKYRERDPSVFSAKEIVDMATENGSRALGMDLGSIEVGNKADFVLIRSERQLNDIYSDLVYFLNQGDVEYTVVNGEVKYRKGEFLGIDYVDVLDKVNDIRERIIPSGM